MAGEIETTDRTWDGLRAADRASQILKGYSDNQISDTVKQCLQVDISNAIEEACAATVRNAQNPDEAPPEPIPDRGYTMAGLVWPQDAKQLLQVAINIMLRRFRPVGWSADVEGAHFDTDFTVKVSFSGNLPPIKEREADVH